ncbi:membrane protein [Streptomyces sp. 150FB]|uniref:hypothetical protein n=1 Tax=Streptomyces sp. 150FB TaxID=1576605 RepID=UPI0005890B25|nr:hypothetical protein [Streptomyces sp. 150FB]KIF78848.1 membrane protein [Streptomyces sp. 150FB]
MDTLLSTTSPSVPLTLRKLYFLRFAFAAVWAALLFTTADTLGPLSVALLVIYPLFDVAAAIVDVRSAKANGDTAPALYVNIAISSLAVIGLALAATSGIPDVLRIWGVWAVASGIVQLVAGTVRRALGGQWAMIISGAISAFAGTSFFLQAGSDDPTLGNLAGYAFLGGVFFLISALRLKRARNGA